MDFTYVAGNKGFRDGSHGGKCGLKAGPRRRWELDGGDAVDLEGLSFGMEERALTGLTERDPLLDIPGQQRRKWSQPPLTELTAEVGAVADSEAAEASE